MRTIDADALKAQMKDVCMGIMSGIISYDEPLKTITNAPTLSTQQWIPCSERLPENDEMVLVSCETKKGIKVINRAYYMDGYWHGSGTMSGVKAWMPLPEPYEGK